MRRLPELAVAAIVLSSVCAAALAQDVQEVRVEATRVMTKTPAGRSTSGIPLLDVSLRYGVSLAGLNLATSSGAKEASMRVHEAAMAACKEIGRQYPDSTPSDRECANQAAAKAMIRVHELVAEAEKSGGAG